MTVNRTSPGSILSMHRVDASKVDAEAVAKAKMLERLKNPQPSSDAVRADGPANDPNRAHSDPSWFAAQRGEVGSTTTLEQQLAGGAFDDDAAIKAEIRMNARLASAFLADPVERQKVYEAFVINAARRIGGKI